MQQMLCYNTALGYWRRLRSDPIALTMGVIYWQLNDIWAGASWSSLDYGVHRWKPLHYAVKRQFAAVSLTVAEGDEKQLQVFAVSDLVQPTNILLKVTVLSLSDGGHSCSSNRRGRQPAAAAGTSRTAGLYSYADTISLPGLSAMLVWTADVSAVLADSPGCSRSSCYIQVSATTPDGKASEATAWLSEFKDMSLSPTSITLSGFTQVSPSVVRFNVSSKAVAPLALLETELEGFFDDNALTVHPCYPRAIHFWSWRQVNADVLQSQLEVSSLFDHQFFQPAGSS